MNVIEQLEASLLLEKYRTEEIRRLTEKAAIMTANSFDDRARQSDAAWRERNDEILRMAESKLRIIPPCPVPAR